MTTYENPEDEMRYQLSLAMLVLFLKYKTIPSNVVPVLMNGGLIVLHVYESDDSTSGFTCAKLTYRGRRLAQKFEKVFKQSSDDDSWMSVDQYKVASINEEHKFLMHHKRLRSELKEGKLAKLLSLYDRKFDDF